MFMAIGCVQPVVFLFCSVVFSGFSFFRECFRGDRTNSYSLLSIPRAFVFAIMSQELN